MARLTHMSIKVDDLDKESELYESLFGFKYMSTVQSDGHVSRHLTDGTVVLTLMKYDSEDAPEATLAGSGPCIHHFGLEVDDPVKYEQQLKKYGCEMLSWTSKGVPLKFRTPGGVVAEFLVSDSIPKS